MRKSSCLSSIFHGVRPVGTAAAVHYRVVLRVRGKAVCFGDFLDVTYAALVYDYVVTQLHEVYGERKRECNTEKYHLDSKEEKERVNERLAALYAGADSRFFGVRCCHGNFYVRLSLPERDRCSFGPYTTQREASLVHDYICRLEKLSQPLNFPLLSFAELRNEIDEGVQKRVDEAISCSSPSLTCVSKSPSSSSSFEKVRDEFRESVSHGPEYVCCCCHQLWFRRSVVHISPALNEKVSTGRLAGVLSDISDWVCMTCSRYLHDSKAPPCSRLRYPGFPRLPDDLSGLTSIESDLIALRIAFMKIRGPGYSSNPSSTASGQLCLSGMVVNVPTDLSRIQTVLPRSFSPEDTLTVKLKRRMRYKSYYEIDNVRPQKIISALRYLVTNDTLWKSAGVTVRPDWIQSIETIAPRADMQLGIDSLSNDSEHSGASFG